MEEEKGPEAVKDYLTGNDQEKKPDHQKKTWVLVPGTDKRGWLSWESGKAKITSFDEMQKSYHMRLKKCPAFDDLELIQAENQEFGTPDRDKTHFNTDLTPLMEELARHTRRKAKSIWRATAKSVEIKSWRTGSTESIL